MIRNVKSYIEFYLFFLVVLIFVVYKIPHLSAPLFWDGLGVYGRSVFTLLDTEIGFQPKYLDPELSRGHPMLYVYLTAHFTKLFGSNVFGMHLFNLLVSVVTLRSTFYIGTKLWNKRIALFASLLLVSQPLFIAQSVLVLPEMLLTLFVLWSVYFFLKEKWILYFISLSLAMMTKETAIFLPPVLAFVLFFWQLFFYKKVEIKKLIIIASPFITFFTFLLLQKVQNGWYFFPYHNPFDGEKDFLDVDLIISKGRDFLKYVFLSQGRKYAFYTTLIPFLLAWFLWNTKDKFKTLVLLATVFGLILFSTTNHFGNRYMLVALPFTALIISFTIFKVLKFSQIAQFVLVSFFVACTLFQYKSSKFSYDDDMSYLSMLEYHKEVVLFLESQEDWNKVKTITSSFPINVALLDRRYGFCEACPKIKIHSSIKSDSEYIIETNNGSWENYKIPENYIQIPFEEKGFNAVRIFKKQ